MEDQLPDHSRPAWEALHRERTEKLQLIEEQEQVKSEADIITTQARDRITQIDNFMRAFMSFYLQRDPIAQVEPDLTPGGPCPLSDDDLLAIAGEGGYPAALVALARATPGRHLHGRTASRWLMDAGVLTGNLDASRTKIAKHMQRSSEWEQVGRGWYRLVETNVAEFHFMTPEEPAIQEGRTEEETGPNTGTSST